MERYKWQGVTLEGKHCSGQDIASSTQELRNFLQARDIGLLSADTIETVHARKSSIFKRKILTIQEKISFFEHVAILLESGIDIVTILQIVERQARGIYKRKISALLEAVQSGFSLAKAAIHIGVFSSLEQELMIAAEHTGNRVSVLQELAQYAQQKIELKKKVSHAIAIPLITLSVAVIVVFILSHVVLPGFESLFASMNKKVPALSQALFAIARGLRTVPLSVLLGIGIVGLLLSRIEKPKRFFYKYIMHVAWYMPVIRLCIIEHHLYHYFQATRLYCMSGLPFEQALKKALNVVSYIPYKKALQEMLGYVQQGYPASDAARKIGSKLVPDEYITLLVVGENSGKMITMLQRASLLLDYSLKRRMSLITCSIGPVMLLIVGGIVALVMVAVYIPIFTFARMF